MRLKRKEDFLRQSFTAIPKLKTNFGFSEVKLQDALNKLQEKVNTNPPSC